MQSRPIAAIDRNCQRIDRQGAGRQGSQGLHGLEPFPLTSLIDERGQESPVHWEFDELIYCQLQDCPRNAYASVEVADDRLGLASHLRRLLVELPHGLAIPRRRIGIVSGAVLVGRTSGKKSLASSGEFAGPWRRRIWCNRRNQSQGSYRLRLHCRQGCRRKRSPRKAVDIPAFDIQRAPHPIEIPCGDGCAEVPQVNALSDQGIPTVEECAAALGGGVRITLRDGKHDG
jgi:hypothetical protein